MTLVLSDLFDMSIPLLLLRSLWSFSLQNNEVLTPLEPVQGHQFKPQLCLQNRGLSIVVKKKCILKDTILLGNDFVEAIFTIVVSCFDGSRLDGLLFCRGGFGCLACLVLYFVEAPFMSIFCVWFAPFLATMWGVNGLAVTVSSMPAILICSNCSSRFFTCASTLVASIESFSISLAVSRSHISGWSWSSINPATQWLRKALLSKLALTETKHQVCGDSLISSEDPSRSMVGEIWIHHLGKDQRPHAA